MGFFKNIFSHTLIYKAYNCFASFIQYIKDYNIVAESLYSEAFNKVLLRYLNKPFKKDWIGRLYAVINPNIDINGKFNVNNTIIELDDERTNNQAYVENWIYKQLDLVANVFKIQNMYSYISLGIEHVGPKEHDNYLVVFDITSRIDWMKALKKFFIHLSIYILIAGIIIGTLYIL